ncbi:MAG: GntR family transcriptional regulator [Anaerolineales bacterium]
MELIRVDTQRAYERIRQMITTLELAPGITIDEGRLAEDLDMGLVPIREALKLLIHDNLVEVSSQGGISVSGVSIPELEQISELRRLLESYCARQAAQRATPDDIVILEALRQEQATIPLEDSQRWLDHKFHQAIARAAHNKYLAQTLDHFFGLSQRLWYLALPHLEFLPGAVEVHLDLVQAIKDGDADQAEALMSAHVRDFYAKVSEILAQKD